MISKWWVALMVAAMLPFAWWMGHNKDADFINTFCGAFAVIGLVVLIGIVIFAPPYLQIG